MFSQAASNFTLSSNEISDELAWLRLGKASRRLENGQSQPQLVRLTPPA